MLWWAWVAGGAVLLGAELTLVDAQLYLVLIGGSAICTGLSCLAAPGQPAWLQWALFSFLAIVSMVSFRRRLYGALRPQLPVVHAGPLGDALIVPEDLSPGAHCRLEHRGSIWTAVNSGEERLAAGASAKVVRVEGLTLMLRARP